MSERYATISDQELIPVIDSMTFDQGPSEMVVDIVNLWALNQGVAPFFGALTLDIHHTSHYGFGYLADQLQPRMAMASHLSFDRELIGEMVAGLRIALQGAVRVRH